MTVSTSIVYVAGCVALIPLVAIEEGVASLFYALKAFVVFLLCSSSRYPDV